MRTTKTVVEKVERETLNAYSDCNDLGSEPRNLGFRASAPVSPKEATEIMEKACPEYNAFSAKVLAKFLPEDAQVWLAREGSVCVYVDKIGDVKSQGHSGKLAELFDADEFDYIGVEWRIWWD